MPHERWTKADDDIPLQSATCGQPRPPKFADARIASPSPGAAGGLPNC